jgi:hypothetical protein
MVTVVNPTASTQKLVEPHNISVQSKKKAAGKSAMAKQR